MSAFEAFIGSFAKDTATNINNRKDKAENYYDQQMERARTVGAENLAKRRERLRGLTSISNNLMNTANMPEDVLRAVANEGPEALNKAYEIYDMAAKAGKEVDESFWRDVYKFTKEVKPSDQPLSEFLGQVAGLMPANLKATEKTGGDPFSAFVSSGMGYNAMDEAADRLETTEVADGYSARELINMEGEESGRPLGDTGFGLDLEATYARIGTKEPKGDVMSDTTIMQWEKAFKEEVDARKIKARLAGAGTADKPGEDVPLTPEQEAAIEAEVAQEMIGTTNNPEDLITRSAVFKKALGTLEEVAPEEGEITTTPLDPVEHTSSYPQTFKTPKGLDATFVKEDGDSVIYNINGVDRRIKKAQLDEFTGTTGEVAPPEAVKADTEQLLADTDPVATRLKFGIESQFAGKGAPEDFKIMQGETPPLSFTVTGTLGIPIKFTYVGEQDGSVLYVDEDGAEFLVPVERN